MMFTSQSNLDGPLSNIIEQIEKTCFIKGSHFDLLRAIADLNAKQSRSSSPELCNFGRDSCQSFTPSECTPIRAFYKKTASHDHSEDSKDHSKPPYGKHIISSNTWPHSAYGLIFIEDQNYPAPLWSSGVLVGPDLVLTTAHTIYDTKNKKKYDKITFYPAVDSETNNAPFGKAEVVRTYIPDAFEKDATLEEGEGRRDEHDYGLLVLKNAIGYKAGYLGIHLDATATSLSLFGVQCIKVVGHSELIQEGRKKFVVWDVPVVTKDFNSEDSLSEDNKTLCVLYAPFTSTAFVTLESPYTGTYHSIAGLYTLSTSEKVGFCDNVAKSNTDLSAESYMHKKLVKLSRSQLQVWLETEKGQPDKRWRDVIGIKIKESVLADESSLQVLFSYFSLPNVRVVHLEKVGLSESNLFVLDKIRKNWPNIEKVKVVKCIIKGNALISFMEAFCSKGLEALELERCTLKNKEMRDISRNSSWNSLHSLNLLYNNFGTEKAIALSKNLSWTSLHILNLESCKISSQGAAALSKNTSWTALHTLNLRRCTIGSQGAAALSKNTSWTNLHTLYLSYNNIGSEGTIALSKNKSWTALRALDIGENQIGPEGAVALSENSSWSALHRLDLRSNIINSEGAAALSKNTSWVALHTLRLSSNNIRNKGVESLSKNSSWVVLHTLDLIGNSIGSEGITALSRNKSWTFLHSLNLEYNTIGDEGIVALSKNTSWTSLNVLNLGRNSVTPKSVATLLGNSFWISFRALIFHGYNIRPEDAVHISKVLSQKKFSSIGYDYCVVCHESNEIMESRSFTS